jgi:Arc/MetJ-type ribon-helix-helix transcriptional regulator
MKERVSATVDEKTIKLIDLILKKGKYRNKSHVIEKAIEILAEEEKNVKKK